MSPTLSIIIPVAPNDRAWKNLLPVLRAINFPCEIIFAGAQDEPKEFKLENANHQNVTWRWLKTLKGRARQLNLAAQVSSAPLVWFLHADSEILAAHLQTVQSINPSENVLSFFKLAFEAKSAALMHVTSTFANFRAARLGMPFGDQGFVLPAKLFWKVGGFNESAPYGEDHLLAWSVRQNGFSLRCLSQSLRTSSRKYRQHGWFRTSINHVRLTISQAAPEFFTLYFKAKRTRRPAVVCFVKTPGYSPIKSRLAKSIGQKPALEIYETCLQRIRDLFAKLKSSKSQIAVYWAVAEIDALADERWKNHPIVIQAPGDLGERLKSVYEHLIQFHSSVSLIGADCPALTTELIEQSIDLTLQRPYVLGPATDGGYYIFTGTAQVDGWLDIPYSSAETFSVFKKVLEKKGDVGVIAPLSDIDEKVDVEEFIKSYSLGSEHATSDLAAVAAKLKDILNRVESSEHSIEKVETHA